MTFNLNEHDRVYLYFACLVIQWYSNLSFRDIDNVVSISEILTMYSPYHEMDISQFCDKMLEIYEKRKEIFKTTDDLLAREYVIITNGEILMWIKEVFPISSFK